MEDKNKTISSEISELKEAVKSQGQKMDAVQERIGKDICRKRIN